MLSRTAAVEQFYRSLRRAGFICLLVLTTLPARAWPPTYGSEFEMKNKALAASAEKFSWATATGSPERKAQMAYVKKITERCLAGGGCKVVPVKGKWGANEDYRVEYPDGWWFKISMDPGCVEISFKPSTLATLREKAALIDDHIFKTGEMIGLTHDPENNTHFNTGIRSAFDDNAEDFLRYFVDYANHSDLALGSLGDDLYNGPPIAIMGDDEQVALRGVISDFVSGALKTISDVARRIQSRVYLHTYDPSWGGLSHYQAFGLKYVTKADLTKTDAPFELRPIWSQGSAEQFIKIGELMEGRIRYLKATRYPIVYAPSTRKEFYGGELRSRFMIYVEEAGMKISDFESLLPDWIRAEPYDDFVRRDANVWERLADAENYWDMLLTSAWVRQKMVVLLSDSRIQGDKQTKKLLRRLQTEIGGLTDADPRKGLLLDVQKHLQERMLQMAKSEPLWRPIAVAPMCSAIFH